MDCLRGNRRLGRLNGYGDQRESDPRHYTGHHRCSSGRMANEFCWEKRNHRLQSVQFFGSLARSGNSDCNCQSHTLRLKKTLKE